MRRMLIRLSALAAAVCFVIPGSVALADEDEPAIVSPATVERARAALAEDKADQAIALLSPRPPSGAATCVLGQALLQRGDRVGADLYLHRCLRSRPDPELQSLARANRKSLKEGKKTQVSLTFHPESASARLAAAGYEQDELLSSEDLWLPVGRFEMAIEATDHEAGRYAVVVEDATPFTVPIRLPRAKGAENAEVDFSEERGEGVGTMQTTADPRPKKFAKLQVLGGRADRAPDPLIGESPPPNSDTPVWPWLSLVGGLGAGGLGLGLQLDDRLSWAIVSYGAATVLIGAGIYGLSRPPSKSGVVMSAGSDHAVLGWSFELGKP